MEIIGGWKLLILFITGILAGINNVLAGGGSLVTMPLLIFMGLDSASANGTNRLAIAIQNIFAVAGFKKKGVGEPRFSLMLTLPALPGVILGAIFASTIDDQLFRKVLSGVMILVLVLILTKRKRAPGNTILESDLTNRQKYLAMLAFAGIGFYSGFIQAGVGFLVIGSLTTITGLDLVRVNAHKVLIIGLLTWVAVVVFLIYGKIDWLLAMVLAAGTGLGGWIGSHAAVAGGEKWIKRVLTLAVLLMALKLSGIADYAISALR